MSVRTTQIYNTLTNQDSSPNVGATVTALLVILAGTADPLYNVSGSYFGTTITPLLQTTKTAGTAPTTTLTATDVTGSGSLGTGNYKYVVSYMVGTVESAASAASNTMAAVSGDHATLSAIPLGAAGTTARNIYRTAAGGSTYTLLTTISDNTTTTFSDTLADGALGTQTPLVLGGYRLNLVAPADLLPATLFYNLIEAGSLNPTTSFIYTTPVIASSVYNSNPTPATPTCAMTGYIVDPGGVGINGARVTASLAPVNGTSTVSSVTVSTSQIFTATTASTGGYTLNLIPTDRMTPTGLYYKVTENSGTPARTITAPHGGGTVTDPANAFAAVAPGSTAAVILSPGTVQTGTLSISGAAQVGAIKGAASEVPTFAGVTGGLGTGSTSGSATGVGSDLGGTVSITNGSASWATGAQATITYFDTTRATAPRVNLYPGNSATALLWSTLLPYATSTAMVASINFAVADSGTHSFVIHYFVEG